MPSPAAIPHALLSLSDDEMNAVLAAARGLQQCDRPAFLELLATHVAALSSAELGEGTLHRAVRCALTDLRFTARKPARSPAKRQPAGLLGDLHDGMRARDRVGVLMRALDRG